MASTFSKRARGLDWFLLIPAGYLLIISLLVLRSIERANEGVDFSIASHGAGIGMGLFAMFILLRTNIATWQRAAYPLFWASMLSLVAVLAFGEDIQGSRRWIDIGTFQFQPSEVVKVGVVMGFSYFLARQKKHINEPLQLLKALVFVAGPTALIVMQPDLGTAVVVVVLWMSILTASYIRKSIIGAMTITGLVALVGALPFLADYQKARITSFLAPQADAQGAGYNAIQSLIAIGSGGLIGNGLSGGSQGRLSFLPSQHTDFIFAIVAERLGMIGALSVIIALVILLLRTLMISWRSESDFMRFMSLGVFVLFAMQAVVNIGMNLALLPVTGLPLPLVSYGGTHIAIELFLIGLLLAGQRK